LSHGARSYIWKRINAVVDSLMLYIQHDFYNIIFKMEDKLYIDLGSPPPSGKKSGCARVWMETPHLKYIHFK
jgi:hypothetical protein